MNALQVRLFAARAARAAQAQEEFARLLRPPAEGHIRHPRDHGAAPRLTLVVSR